MLSMLGVLLTSLFHKPATVRYPRAPRRITPTARGHIEIEIESCVFCGLCRKKCPTGAIDVNRGERLWAIERLHCILCNGCVECCPKKCLSMRPEPTPVSTGSEVDCARVPADASNP